MTERAQDDGADAGADQRKGEDQSPGVNAVWAFLAITVLISTTVVYVIGNLLDNADATILTVLVPSLVAIVMTGTAKGRLGVRRLLRLRGTNRSSVRLLALAAFGTPLVALAAIGSGTLVTGDSHNFGLPDDGIIVLLPLLVIALGEEYGWRGYALPGLQTRYSGLVAAIIVGVVHWLWHYPPSLLDTGVPLDTPFWLFGLWVVALSVLMMVVYNASGGAVGLMILFHFASNLAFVFLPLLPENTDDDVTTFSIFVGFAVAAAVAAVLFQRRTGGHPLLSKSPARPHSSGHHRGLRSARPRCRAHAQASPPGPERTRSVLIRPETCRHRRSQTRPSRSSPPPSRGTR